MSLKQPVNVWYDSDIPGLIDSNVSGTISQTTVFPQIFDYGDYVLRMRIYDQAPATKNLTNVSSFSMEIGELGGEVFITANNASFNSSADWSLVNVGSGQISVRFDSNVAALSADLGTSTWKQYYCEILGSNTTTGDTLTVMVCPIRIRNTVGI